MNVLLTGATGFVGGHLLSRLNGFEVSILGRRRPSGFTGSYHNVELGSQSNYCEALQNVDLVIHCAAITSVAASSSLQGTREKLRQVNAIATRNLARQAAECGVSRFIFISTIKVLGEISSPASKLLPNDIPNPFDDYALSKLEAEQYLDEISEKYPIEVVIIRPPLVYGYGAAANFNLLAKLIRTRIPLPFAASKNRRSFVCIDNLIDLILVCLTHPQAASQKFLVSDDHDVSLADLVTEMSNAMGINQWMLPIPVPMLVFMLKLLGKRDVASRLFDSLQVDIAGTKERLGWAPPVSFSQGIRNCFVS